MPQVLRLGTRGSALALKQAAMAERAFLSLDLSCETHTFTTTGDAIPNVPLYDLGGKALFCRELDQALLDGHIDVAVHSLKDMPAVLPAEIELVAILDAADTRDALVSKNGETLAHLPHGARIGTCSLRRQAQLRSIRADLEMIPLRGNVPTRLQKVKEGQVDAIVLAVAGLERLEQQHHISQIFSPEEMLPAVGQGAIALVCRRGDTALQQTCAELGMKDAWWRATAERAFLAALGGSCRTPVGGYAVLAGESLTLHTLIASPDARQVFRTTVKGNKTDAVILGRQAALELCASAGSLFLEKVGCAINV